MTQTSPDQLTGKELLALIDKGFMKSFETVVKQARYHGTPLICWQDGKIVELDPYDFPIS